MAALTSSLGSLQLGIASSCSCSDKATAASLGSRFSVQNGVSLRPALRIASLKASSSSSASAAVKVCAVGAAVSEDNEVDLEAYVKSVLPGGFAAARLWGTGRRKTAVARVVLVDGTGQIIINNRTAQVCTLFYAFHFHSFKFIFDSLKGCRFVKIFLPALNSPFSVFGGPFASCNFQTLVPAESFIVVECLQNASQFSSVHSLSCIFYCSLPSSATPLPLHCH